MPALPPSSCIIRSADNSDDLGAPGVEVRRRSRGAACRAERFAARTEYRRDGGLAFDGRAKGRRRPRRICRRPRRTTLADPDRIVSPVDAKKPVKEEDQKRRRRRPQPSEQSVATEATAMTSVEGAIEVTADDGAVTRHRQQRGAAAGDLGKGTRRAFRQIQALSRPSGPMKAAQVVVSFVLDRMGHIVRRGW